jgi:hypothetical protein
VFFVNKTGALFLTMRNKMLAAPEKAHNGAALSFHRLGMFAVYSQFRVCSKSLLVC